MVFCFRSVLIISALRVQALYEVGSIDVTYSKCYLGLLTEVGAFMSIITCCTPSLMPILVRTGAWARHFHSLMTVFGRSTSRRTRSRMLPTGGPEMTRPPRGARNRHRAWWGEASYRSETRIGDRNLAYHGTSYRARSRSRVRWAEVAENSETTDMARMDVEAQIEDRPGVNELERRESLAEQASEGHPRSLPRIPEALSAGDASPDTGLSSMLPVYQIQVAD